MLQKKYAQHADLFTYAHVTCNGSVRDCTNITHAIYVQLKHLNIKFGILNIKKTNIKHTKIKTN